MNRASAPNSFRRSSLICVSRLASRGRVQLCDVPRGWKTEGLSSGNYATQSRHLQFVPWYI